MTTAVSTDTRRQTVEAASPSEVGAKHKANTFIRIMAIVTPLLSFAVQNWVLITAVVLGGRIGSLEIAMLAGGLIGVFLMPLIIMLLFQIGRRFRNPRSRWTIFLSTGLFFLAVSILSAFVRALT